jgi:hypothetical protein
VFRQSHIACPLHSVEILFLRKKDIFSSFLEKMDEIVGLIIGSVDDGLKSCIKAPIHVEKI